MKKLPPFLSNEELPPFLSIEEYNLDVYFYVNDLSCNCKEEKCYCLFNKFINNAEQQFNIRSNNPKQTKEKGIAYNVLDIVGDIPSYGKCIPETKGAILYNVDFRVLFLKPNTEEEVKSKVGVVLSEAVMVRVYGILQVLLMSEVFKNKGYIFVNNKFINNKTGDVIEVGSYIYIKLNEINFERSKFKCFSNTFRVI